MAVRWRNGKGRMVFSSKAEACRVIGITMKKLDKCLQNDEPVWINCEKWYLDLLV